MHITGIYYDSGGGMSSTTSDEMSCGVPMEIALEYVSAKQARAWGDSWGRGSRARCSEVINNSVKFHSCNLAYMGTVWWLYDECLTNKINLLLSFFDGFASVCFKKGMLQFPCTFCPIPAICSCLCLQVLSSSYLLAPLNLSSVVRLERTVLVRFFNIYPFEGSGSQETAEKVLKTAIPWNSSQLMDQIIRMQLKDNRWLSRLNPGQGK
ncbi:hypothetical protein Ancab_013182 [Ancistrocladus abbreviatus]